MAKSFSRTMRSLEERRFRPVGLFVALGFAAAWSVWMFRGSVDIYASSSQARLEVTGLPHRVSTREAGRIVTLNVGLGRAVTVGEALLELDTSVEVRRLEEASMRVTTLEPRAAALRGQIAAAEASRASHWALNASAIDRAKVELAQAETVFSRQEKLGAMAQRLNDEQLLSHGDRLKAEGELADSKLKVAQARAEISRLIASQTYDDRQEASRIADLAQKLAEIEAERSADVTQVETARAEIERRTVRAPATGKLGNISPLQIGDVLKAGDVIATVIPPDEVHVVAELAPQDAFGRVLPGQNARVRVSGFAWTQYGMLDAVVTRVANEPHDGTARVELVLREGAPHGIPVQHGLPGSVDIEVERVTPWTLLLRSAGSIATPAQPPPVPPAVAVSP